MSDATSFLMIGGYTPPAGTGPGLTLAEFNLRNATLRCLGSSDAFPNTTFVAPSPTLPVAYAVSEADTVKRQEVGSVVSFDLRSGTPVPTSSIKIGSRGPTHVATSPDGDYVIVSNYAGGAVSAVRVGDDGQVSSLVDVAQHSGSSVDHIRQEGPHVHSATFDPTGARILVCDLGLDVVRVYMIQDERLVPLSALEIQTPPGTGPRHIDFSPDGRSLYVAGELASTLLVYSYDPATGASELLQVADTLGQSVPPSRNYPADVHVHPSGRFIYVSNRGLDAIATFGIERSTGRVTLLGNEPSGGKWPRNFAIDPTGQLLLAANQRTDDVVPFWVDQGTGQLEAASSSLEIGAPSCLRFLPWVAPVHA